MPGLIQPAKTLGDARDAVELAQGYARLCQDGIKTVRIKLDSGEIAERDTRGLARYYAGLAIDMIAAANAVLGGSNG